MNNVDRRERLSLFLEKGESINFLDYTIKNSSNDDGIVLMKSGSKAMFYECHLGNYGEGTEENVDSCKRYAILYFMTARPELFATTIVNKMTRLNSGTASEYYLFKSTCDKEGIEMPSEIGAGGISGMIYFKNKPLIITK